MLKNADLLSYQKDKTYINWCRVTGSKNQLLNHSLPILNQLLTAQRISARDSYADSSTLQLGDCPQHHLITCYQDINEDSSIGDMALIDFSNMTLDQLVARLDLLKIRIPFSHDQLEKNINSKFFTQSIPAKSVIRSEDVQRYVDNIQIIALYTDLLKPSKEFPMDRIIPVFDQLFASIKPSDMTKQISDVTRYDLSSVYLLNSNVMISFDKSDHVQAAHINDIDLFLNDFTNMFIDNTVILSKDETFINHHVAGGTVVAQTDQSHYTLQYNSNSHFDQSFTLLKENIFGDRDSQIQSYIVPIYTEQVLSDRIPGFFMTEDEGVNEQLKNMNISYGRHVRDILRFYYGFNDDLTKLILQLILAQVIKNTAENPLSSEISELLSGILGTQVSGLKQTNEIKSLESKISAKFSDMTGINKPIIYHTSKIDFTTKNLNNSFHQTLDDLYILVKQLNTLEFVYILDMGYDDNLNMRPMAAIVSKDSKYVSSGYLSMFSASSEINV